MDPNDNTNAFGTLPSAAPQQVYASPTSFRNTMHDSTALPRPSPSPVRDQSMPAQTPCTMPRTALLVSLIPLRQLPTRGKYMPAQTPFVRSPPPTIITRPCTRLHAATPLPVIYPCPPPLRGTHPMAETSPPLRSKPGPAYRRCRHTSSPPATPPRPAKPSPLQTTSLPPIPLRPRPSPLRSNPARIQTSCSRPQQPHGDPHLPPTLRLANSHRRERRARGVNNHARPRHHSLPSPAPPHLPYCTFAASAPQQMPRKAPHPRGESTS